MPTASLKNRIGIVPQDMAFYDELNAMDNLLFWGGLYDVPRADLKRRAAEILELVELAGRAKEPVKNFSGGMKRRLNTAIGLLHKPDLLLLDEPTVGIDVQAKVSILDIIRSVGAAGTAVIFTTHQLAEVETTCSRIAIMDHGRILAQGTLDELVRIVGERDIVEIAGDFAAASFSEALRDLAGSRRRAALRGRQPGLAGRRRHGRDPADHGPPVPTKAGRDRPEDQVARPRDRVPEADRPQPEGLSRAPSPPHPRERRAPPPQGAAGPSSSSSPSRSLMTGLIGIIFAPRTDGSELPPIPVLLVDQDKGLASKLILGSFDVDQMKKMFQVTVTDEADGRAGAWRRARPRPWSSFPRASPSTCWRPSR